MRHARSDYASIQPAHGQTTIEDDEPVFVLRARDVCAPIAVRQWSEAARLMGGHPMIIAAARAWADEMEAWAAVHGCHTPDAPLHVLFPE